MRQGRQAPSASSSGREPRPRRTARSSRSGRTDSEGCIHTNQWKGRCSLDERTQSASSQSDQARATKSVRSSPQRLGRPPHAGRGKIQTHRLRGDNAANRLCIPHLSQLFVAFPSCTGRRPQTHAYESICWLDDGILEFQRTTEGFRLPHRARQSEILLASIKRNIFARHNPLQPRGNHQDRRIP